MRSNAATATDKNEENRICMRSNAATATDKNEKNRICMRSNAATATDKNEKKQVIYVGICLELRMQMCNSKFHT